MGIAAARGIALAAGKPAIGLSTLAAFAAPLIAADDTLPVVVAIDARHDHVYLQVFGPGGRTLVAPRIAPLREALRVSSTGAPRITGKAASMMAAAWPAGERPPIRVEQRGAPDIGWVARLERPQPTLVLRRSRFTCARPMLIRRTRCNWHVDDRIYQQSVQSGRTRPVRSEHARCFCHGIPARSLISAGLE